MSRQCVLRKGFQLADFYPVRKITAVLVKSLPIFFFLFFFSPRAAQVTSLDGYSVGVIAKEMQ